MMVKLLVGLLIFSFLGSLVSYLLSWDFRYDPIWSTRFEGIGHAFALIVFLTLVLLLGGS